MRKLLPLIFTAILFISSCTPAKASAGNLSERETFEPSGNALHQMTEEISEPVTAASEVRNASPLPASTPKPLPEKPKYIFYVIGDGMGYAHLLVGNVYEKLLRMDWGYQTLWDGFSQQKLVEACGESAGGGTALATGYITNPGIISKTPEGEDLVTIMDRAKDAGFATGVISNASLTDATPATFAAHAVGRFKFTRICNEMALSDIDFLAGGGMQHMLDEDSARQWGSTDTADRKVLFEGSPYVMDSFMEEGYTPFWGIDGTIEYNNTLDSFDVNSGDKILALFEATNMLYQSYKYKRQRAETCTYEPDLDEMTKSAIDFLSKDDDGFILMIEEALIDKSCHYNDLAVTAQEMHMMHKTLETIFDFYAAHPDETLIIISADHECGYFKYTDEAYEKITALPVIDWRTEYSMLYTYLIDECGIDVSSAKLRTFMETGDMDLWGDDDEDYALVHCLITKALCEKYGIYSRSDKHSSLPVPCYSHGLKAEVFSRAGHISDIPILICEIMQWDKLPEVME